MNPKALLLFILLSPVVHCLGQETVEVDSTIANKSKLVSPTYLDFTAGSGYSYFRDFATAPLFYYGIAGNLSLHYERNHQDVESRFGISGIYGAYGFNVNRETAGSNLLALNLDYSRLYRIKSLSEERWHVKVGGMALFTANFRNNPDLQNAAFGLEFIYNLMASAKVVVDASRRKAKSGKFLFIKYDWKPRRRYFTYQLNVGLMNAHYRNGYAYVDQSGLIDQPALFNDYENTLFQGIRLNSKMSYTIFLNQLNAVRISFLWDAYTTGEEGDSFEMASRFLNFSFLFLIK